MDRFRIVEKVLSEELAKPYDYGDPDKSDCFFMGCAMIDALTGTELVKKYAGTYNSLAGAQKALRRRKHKSLVTFFGQILGQEPVGAAEAGMGDIAILRLSDGAEHVAICTGLRFVTKTPQGRQDYGIPEVISAYKIG